MESIYFSSLLEAITFGELEGTLTVLTAGEWG